MVVLVHGRKYLFEDNPWLSLQEGKMEGKNSFSEGKKKTIHSFQHHVTLHTKNILN
jgi:hypothetical protein